MLIGAFGLLFVDRHYGASLFSGFTGSRGGNPLIWPRLFWFGAYPVLWALLIPALGAVSEIVATFAGRPLFSRDRASAALVGVGVLSFAGWGSEVSTLTRARPLFDPRRPRRAGPGGPADPQLAGHPAARRQGGRPRRPAPAASPPRPMLWALGMLPVLGLGLAASVVSAIDAGRDAHANYWQVGQQHALFFGAATIGAVAALSFWGPKLWGRRLSDALGKLEILAVVGGTLLTVLGMLLLGVQDMLVHTSTFDSGDDWDLGNLVVSAGGAIVGLGLIVLLLDLLGSVRRRPGAARPAPTRGAARPWSGPPPRRRRDTTSTPFPRSAPAHRCSTCRPAPSAAARGRPSPTSSPREAA